jgi:hypothetical protein
MEHFYPSKTRTCLALCMSIILHLLPLAVLFQHSIHQQANLTHAPYDHETYIAQTLLSAGQACAATVLFQDEDPSGDALSGNIPHADAQQAQESESVQERIDKTSTPLNELEEKTDLVSDTFKAPNPNHQEPEEATTQPVPQQQPSAHLLARTTNKHAVSLADVSRGFIKSIQQEAGYNQASRDIKQLTLQVYATKLWNILKNSFLAGDNGLHLHTPVNVHAQLILTVDRNGSLSSVFLEYPKHITAMRTIERLIISRVHQAGKFPPLPTHIPGTSKTFSFPLFIEGQAGFHAYALGYQEKN